MCCGIVIALLAKLGTDRLQTDSKFVTGVRAAGAL